MSHVCAGRSFKQQRLGVDAKMLLMTGGRRICTRKSHTTWVKIAPLDHGVNVPRKVYAAPIVFERNAYEVPVFTRVHDFMWSGARWRDSTQELPSGVEWLLRLSAEWHVPNVLQSCDALAA